eukprot:7587489-Karenia_brevis.AAC.1
MSVVLRTLARCGTPDGDHMMCSVQDIGKILTVLFFWMEQCGDKPRDMLHPCIVESSTDFTSPLQLTV